MRRTWTTPSVIVATEKHDSRYLDATSEAAFHRSARSLLRERFEAGERCAGPDGHDGDCRPTLGGRP